MAKRRAKGEGSIVALKDGYYQGEVSLEPGPDGKRKRKYVRGKTKREVRQKMDAIKRELADGTYVGTDITLATYLSEWLREKEQQLKPSTFEQYEYCVKGRILPRAGGVKLKKLSPLRVQKLIQDIYEDIRREKGGSDLPKNVGVATANKCRTILYSMFKQAIRMRVVSFNPVESVDPLPTEVREIKLWTPEQAGRFIDYSRSHRLHALFYLAMATGLRRAELIGLRWQDVEGNALVVTETRVKVRGKLVKQTPKTRKGRRRVYISQDVETVLETHRERQLAEKKYLAEAWSASGLVFTSETGTPLNPDNLRRLKNRLMDEAGVPRIRLHDLRHLHASIAIKNGADPKALADRLGHARASFTLDRYTHLFEEQRQGSAVSLTDFLPQKDTENLN